MNSEKTSPPNGLEKTTAASETQPTGIEERLTALEKKMPSEAQTKFLRFGAIAGVLGTLISIAAGSLTLYSGTVRQIHDDQQKVLHEFEGYIQQLNAEDRKRAIISASSDSPSTKIAQLMAANSASYIAAGQAEQLLPKLTNLVTPTQFSLLGEAKAIGGDFNSARMYLINAVSLSKGQERAEVLRFEAGILRNSNEPEDRAIAFAAYSKAFDNVQNNSNYWGASFYEASILGDWLVTEAYVGDCTKAASLLSRFVDKLSNQDVTAEIANAAKANLYNLLVQKPRCALDLSKIRSDLASQTQPPAAANQTATTITPTTTITAPTSLPRQP